MQLNLLYIVTFGFATGVGIRSFVNFGAPFIFFILLIAGALLMYAFIRRRDQKIVVTSLAIFALALGIIRFEFADQFRGDPYLQTVTGERQFEGVVIREPDIRESTSRLVVAFEKVGPRELEPTNIIVLARRYPEYAYGDRLQIVGELQVPQDFETETGRVFRYQDWLAKDDIFYQMFYPSIEVIETEQGNVIKQYLFALKQAFLQNMQSAIPDPEAALAGGLIVGDKRSLGDDLTEAFRATGVIHIVVLSGFNVTIIAEAIRTSLRFLPLMANISVSATLIILFTIMVGASATIVRAATMGLLAMLARATGRTYAITRALFIAGFLMVLHNPKILVYDPSFQLSFLATVGLIHLSPWIEQKLTWIPEWWGFRMFASATIGTLIFVLPFLLYTIGEFSVVAVPANMLVLVAVPFAMLFGFIAGMLGFVSSALAQLVGYIAYALLHYQLLMVELFAAVPHASVVVPAFPFVVVVIAYGVLAWLVVRKRADATRRPFF